MDSRKDGKDAKSANRPNNWRISHIMIKKRRGGTVSVRIRRNQRINQTVFHIPWRFIFALKRVLGAQTDLFDYLSQVRLTMVSKSRVLKQYNLLHDRGSNSKRSS